MTLVPQYTVHTTENSKRLADTDLGYCPLLCPLVSVEF